MKINKVFIANKILFSILIISLILLILSLTVIIELWFYDKIFIWILANSLFLIMVLSWNIYYSLKKIGMQKKDIYFYTFLSFVVAPKKEYKELIEKFDKNSLNLNNKLFKRIVWTIVLYSLLFSSIITTMSTILMLTNSAAIVLQNNWVMHFHYNLLWSLVNPFILFISLIAVIINAIIHYINKELMQINFLTILLPFIYLPKKYFE